jgi:D-galactarolactone isomerase
MPFEIQGLTVNDPVWDCHFHILDSAAPVAATASLPNETATTDQYKQVAKRYGLTHGVVVQPSMYGINNDVTLRALKDLGGNYRAVGVIAPDSDVTVLQQFDQLGMRGVRFNQVQQGATQTQDMPRIAELIQDLDWHIQLHISADALEALLPMLQDLPTRLVLDHIGRCPFDAPDSLRTLLGLYESEHVWIKLSGPYHQRDNTLSFQHNLALAKKLIAIDPSRLVWGSDWPHVTEQPKPPFEELTRFMEEAADDETTLRKIVSLNPTQLYA